MANRYLIEKMSGGALLGNTCINEISKFIQYDIC